MNPMANVLQSCLPHALIIGLVGVAMLRMPYDYYILMRWLVSGCLVYLVIEDWRRGRLAWLIALSVLTGLYNPFVFIGLRREAWAVVNVLTWVVLIAHAWTLLRSSRESPATNVTSA